ncbi:MAG: PD-(D/E)XK nuclease family protein [Bacteroidales bacterium]|nr:PD-(D/E)XK nuclease family protein [Bacteroidales bacterium]
MSTVNCQLSTINSKSLITPQILQLFESHLINLLSDIINPELPFAQTNDEKHCRYCDYAAICKKSTTQDE